MSTVRINTEFLRSRPLPKPGEGSKENRGKVLIICGSAEMAGVPVLTATAAMRSGCGTVQIATARSVAISCGVAIPETLVVALDETEEGGLIANGKLDEMVAKSNAVVVGPGLVDGAATKALLRRVIKAGPDGILIIDAEPLKCVRDFASELRVLEGRVILTPHSGEMAAILDRERGDIEANPRTAALDAASMFDAVVVMKGSNTSIVDPGAGSFVYAGGTVGLATSGSGDVLAGVIGGLAARGASPSDAAIWGVYLHGEAGVRLANRIGDVGLLARELAIEMPPIMRQFDE